MGVGLWGEWPGETFKGVLLGTVASHGVGSPYTVKNIRFFNRIFIMIQFYF